jgi:Domain of unknown function (DUF4159)
MLISKQLILDRRKGATLLTVVFVLTFGSSFARLPEPYLETAVAQSTGQFGQEFGGANNYQRGRGFRRGPVDRSEYPMWEVPKDFAHDLFTFVRIQFDSNGGLVDSQWDNDYPDSDINFSFRLQQLTSIQTDPNGKVLRLDDPALFDYPFAYMLGIKDITFSNEEVSSLRAYLQRGGFLMVDDFWTRGEMEDIRRQMKRVLPDREPFELTIDHPIFHLVYELKEIPQIPSIQAWRRGWDFEYWHGDPEGDEKAHFWGINDDDGNLMVLMCHNNDVGDGWEREGENREYFELYSEKYSYPLGINIITYVMTH